MSRYEHIYFSSLTKELNKRVLMGTIVALIPATIDSLLLNCWSTLKVDISN